MSIVKSKIRRKKYTEQNYQDIKSDIVDLITQQMSSREKFSKKFNRTKVSTENLLYYLDLCQKAKERYPGDESRDTLEKNKKEAYHPYYFLKKKKNELIIVFSGTAEYRDYVLNFKLFRGLLNNILINHLNIASAILFRYNLIQIIKTYKKVTIVGYSLGAVIASYVTLILQLINKRIYSIQNIKFKLYVFGCPVCLPEVLLEYINPITTAVVNEKDPIVCFRGLNITPLFTVGGDNIYNFVMNPKTKEVSCYRRNYGYFMTSGFFYGKQKLSTHYLTNLKQQILSFLKEP